MNYLTGTYLRPEATSELPRNSESELFDFLAPVAAAMPAMQPSPTAFAICHGGPQMSPAAKPPGTLPNRNLWIDYINLK
jgi:hypothetical protein